MTCSGTATASGSITVDNGAFSLFGSGGGTLNAAITLTACTASGGGSSGGSSSSGAAPSGGGLG